ncbi:MAG: hypothetical protein ACTHNS_04350 [Marmoricola sp.]
MDDRQEFSGHSHPDAGGPLVPLLITVVLLALIVFLFWLITATSMASVGPHTGS